jgi:hypothetical protein
MSSTPQKIQKRTKEFNWDGYFKDFSFSSGYWLLALSLLFILFSKAFIELWDIVITRPFLKYCTTDNLITDWIFILYLVFAVVFFIKQCWKGLYTTLNSVAFVAMVLLLYFLIVRYDETNNFYLFRIKLLSGIAYANCFVIGTLLLIITYKSYFKALIVAPTQLSLIDDHSSLSAYTDAYSRATYATSVAKHIMNTSTNSSFAIAVVGEWGSGKTDFLLRLKDELDNDKDNTLVFDFNPWRVSKSDAIIEEFFKTLSKELKPYNQSIHSKLKDYSKRILQTGKEVYFRFFDTLINEWGGDDSIQKQYELINKAISGLSKRIVIFIDDMDRLTGKEVMEVLRIMRNTANFSNMFFVASIDQQYVINVLKGTKDFANEEEYLKKVFQLTITLPAFKKSIFIPLIKEYLLTDDLETRHKTAITDAVSKITTDFGDLSIPFFPAADHDNILEKLTENSRDLKRFCNSFKLAFGTLQDEIDIHDLMVLELLRNRNIEVYNRIRNRFLLDFDVDKSDEFILNKDNWEQFAKENAPALGADELKKLKAAVDYLVTDMGYKNRRKFKEIHNFYLYFSYQLFNLISLKAFNDVLEKSHSDITAKFDEWNNEGKGQELIHITTRVTEFKDSDTLKKMIIAYLNIKHNHEVWLELTKKLLVTFDKYNKNKYFKDDEALYEQFLHALMDNQDISLIDRAELAGRYLATHLYDGEPAILTKTHWQEKLSSLFEEFLKNNDNAVSYTRMMSFYYLNKFEIAPDDRVLINKKASSALKTFLLTNDAAFKQYVRHILRPYYQPYSTGGLVVFEPFLEQIFGKWEEFRDHLQSKSFDDPDSEKIKKIILNHIDSFYTNQKGFKISDKSDEKLMLDMLSNLKS